MIIPNVGQHPGVPQKRYDEVKNLQVIPNKSFDDKLKTMGKNEFAIMTFRNTEPSSGAIGGGTPLMITPEHVHFIFIPETGEVIGSYKDQYGYVRPTEFIPGVKCK